MEDTQTTHVTAPPPVVPEKKPANAAALAEAVARDALKALAFKSPRSYQRVGRYRLLELLGQGGMGVVFHAYDDELARPVALKLLQPRRGESASSRANMRLLREAQAMAQLSHSNVVQVYDVGQHEGQVFIAMELVAGQTLRQWIAELGPPAARAQGFSEIVDCFVQAGRGLAAAHAVGLVHRDFKPSNVLVGDDGGVRVLDFGLARGPFEELAERSDSSSPSSDLATLRVDAGEGSMTATGAILGTPAYISPEQLRAQPAGAASDQFSFCVSLYEALLGVRPYEASSLAELDVQFKRGQYGSVPAGPEIPTWLSAVIERGLAIDPDSRWPSMDALLDALLDNPTVRRRRRWGWGAGAFVIAAAAGGAWGFEQYELARCQAEGEAVASSWSDAVQGDVRAAFMASGAPNAEATWTRVATHIGAWQEAWADAREAACLAARNTSTGTEQSACLERQRWVLDSLVTLLEQADAPMVQHAVAASSSLPEVTRCAEPAWLAAERGLVQASAEEEGVRMDLVRVFTLERAGRYAEALTLATSTAAVAEQLDNAALEAEAAYELGTMRLRAGDYAGAEEDLRAAYFGAGAIGHDQVALDAALETVSIFAEVGSRHGEGQDWWEHARMRLRHMGLDPEDYPPLELTLGDLHMSEALYPEALAAYERALVQMRAQLEPSHPMIAVALTNVGLAHARLGDYESAVASHGEALEVSTLALGPEHPDTAMIHERIALALNRLSRYDEAIATHRHALALQEAVLGPEHVSVASTLANLARVLRHRGEYDEAALLLERALGIYEQSHGPEHRQVAGVLGTLASVEARRGDPRRAIELLERALEIKESALGPEHPSVATTLIGLGMRQQEVGELEAALASFMRALAIDEASAGPEHPDYAADLDSVGVVLHALGDEEQAWRYYRRGQAIREQVLPVDHADHAPSLDHIGQLLRARGELPEAIEHHRRALIIRERSYGLEHRLTASTLIDLGGALSAAGETAEAQKHLLRALEVLEKGEQQAPMLVASAREELSRVHRQLDQPKQAAQQLVRAIALRSERPGDPALLADARFALARLLGPDGESHARLAQAAYMKVGERRAVALGEVEQWLANPVRISG